MKKTVRLFVTLGLLLLIIRPALCEPMEFSIGSEPQRCGDPGCGGWINAIGEITPETPGTFKRFLSKTPYPPVAVRLTSPGGDLIAGLDLGEIIREEKFNTEATICASACAYAFLGGVKRSLVSDKSKLGLHRFYHREAMQQPTLRQFSGVDLDNTQKLMSGLMLYLMKMDIDLRLLSLAAEAGPEEMRWITAQEANELKVTHNPNRWHPWKVKQIGMGLIAYSETEDKTRYMQLGCSNPSKEASFLLLDENGDEDWFRQCLNSRENHSVLGTLIPNSDIEITEHKGAPVLNFFIGKRNLKYTENEFFSNTNLYPMACISQFDNYVGATENLSESGKLALRNCIDQ